jgi:hypothetical protein
MQQQVQNQPQAKKRPVRSQPLEFTHFWRNFDKVQLPKHLGRHHAQGLIEGKTPDFINCTSPSKVHTDNRNVIEFRTAKKRRKKLVRNKVLRKTKCGFHEGIVGFETEKLNS